MRILKCDGPLRLFAPSATLILTDEKQLERIVKAPDQPLFDDEKRGFSGEKHGLYPPGTTLDSFMKDAAQRGCVRVEVSYDYFFGGSERNNYPDSPLTVQAFKVIHDAAARYGMGFGASLISPLDLGGGYVRSHSDGGKTWQIEETAILSGKYSLRMRRQRQWYNNKGPIRLNLEKIHVLAFSEQQIGNSAFFAVDPEQIRDISTTSSTQLLPETYKVTGAGYGYDEILVTGETDPLFEKALIVAEYSTPELDYFSANASSYIHEVIDMHARAGISYQGFYSDEMHIQFDWDLNEHFGETELHMRYVTPTFIDMFCRLYGERYHDFLRFAVFFAYGAHKTESGQIVQHVWGQSDEDIWQTWLFRKRYFELLSKRVVELSLDAKAYAESLFGGPIMTRAHATWQESPTCDRFFDSMRFSQDSAAGYTRYDYDTPYVWSSSIREAMSACYDYFRWNLFLTGSGTDHPEGGNLDRDYYAQALACSFGNLNDFDKAYCACWGSPAPLIDRFTAVGNAYGTGDLRHGFVQGLCHRMSDILLLYPTELNYSEERFGSWMIQYGYGDYITEEMLLKYGKIENKQLFVGFRPYRALVVLYEPFLSSEAVSFLRSFVKSGGTLIWTSTPPRLTDDGIPIQTVSTSNPVSLKGKEITFCGRLSPVQPMRVLTDLLPDLGYPVTNTLDCEIVARCGNEVLGVCKQLGDGLEVFLGFRPRDDQSASTGKDITTLYEILCTLSAYSPDSLESRSRATESPYLMNRFPNGAVSIANHYRTFEENWYGSFFRDDARDEALLKGRILPSYDLHLENKDLDGQTVSYDGSGCLTFRCGPNGELLGFAGESTQGVTINQHTYTLFDRPADLCFAKVEDRFIVSGIRDVYLVSADRPGTCSLPFDAAGFKAGLCGGKPFEITKELPLTSNRIIIQEDAVGKFIAIWRET